VRIELDEMWEVNPEEFKERAPGAGFTWYPERRKRRKKRKTKKKPT
jgi:hypothetical protein